MATRGVFRHSRKDALCVAMVVLQFVGLCALLAAAVANGGTGASLAAGAMLALVMCWCSNSVSHIHLHKPLFRARALNSAFSLLMSVMIGVPQRIWRHRHLWHHAGEPDEYPRLRLGAQGVLEIGAVAASWLALLLLAPRVFVVGYLPGYLLGMLLCWMQGRYEHKSAGREASGGISCYRWLYNRLWFNDGFHAEHHRYPGEHWTRLPARTADVEAEGEVAISRRPPILRWFDDIARAADSIGRSIATKANLLQARALVALERLAIAPGRIQRFMLGTHRRALARLIDSLPRRPRRVRIVGGGHFPRTAIALAEVLPCARLYIVDGSEENLERARVILAARGLLARVTLVHAMYDAASADSDVDLTIIPLGFAGDRAAIYASPIPHIVHDWAWNRAGCAASTIVSWLLLKRVNLSRTPVAEIAEIAASQPSELFDTLRDTTPAGALAAPVAKRTMPR
ncbi:MAG: fatty acid desaturase [Myxococcales bacterium]|nr:fatty acid desaturase [Myxococcales bacterium]